jgi:hypothetical protein
VPGDIHATLGRPLGKYCGGVCDVGAGPDTQSRSLGDPLDWNARQARQHTGLWCGARTWVDLVSPAEQPGIEARLRTGSVLDTSIQHTDPVMNDVPLTTPGEHSLLVRMANGMHNARADTHSGEGDDLGLHDGELSRRQLGAAYPVSVR